MPCQPLRHSSYFAALQEVVVPKQDVEGEDMEVAANNEKV